MSLLKGGTAVVTASEDWLICLQDLLNCLLLSEASYKVVDLGVEGATEVLGRMKETFPDHAVTVSRVQWSLSSVFHRFSLLTEA